VTSRVRSWIGRVYRVDITECDGFDGDVTAEDAVIG